MSKFIIGRGIVPIWKDSKGRERYIHKMTDQHIENALKCCLGGGKTNLPKNYLGGTKKWIEIFNKELKRREVCQKLKKLEKNM